MLYDAGIVLVLVGITLIILGLACYGDGCPDSDRYEDEHEQ
jgi:hypothetical protein